MGSFMERTLRYDRKTITLHWWTAVLVIGLWVMGRTTGWMPRGPLRVDVWSVHILLGLVLAGVVIARIGWRTTRGRRLPPARHGIRHAIAVIVHWLLYATLIGVTGLGIANVFGHGFPMFNGTRLPKIADQQLCDWIAHWHDLAANIIAVLVAVHVAGALYHRFFERDDVLARMSLR